MAKWLSEGWIEDTRELGMKMPPREGMSACLSYVITDTPDGDIEYYWAVKDGVLTDVSLGTPDSPDVILTIAVDDAREMQMGELDPTSAFMQGKIKVDGDLTRLLELLPLTTSVEYQELERELASRTSFEL